MLFICRNTRVEIVLFVQNVFIKFLKYLARAFEEARRYECKCVTQVKWYVRGVKVSDAYLP